METEHDEHPIRRHDWSRLDDINLGKLIELRKDEVARRQGVILQMESYLEEERRRLSNAVDVLDALVDEQERRQS